MIADEIEEVQEGVNALNVNAVNFAELFASAMNLEAFKANHPDWKPAEVQLVDPPGQMKKARGDQVMNNAGGYVFSVSDTVRVRRFLILGTDGPTYYASEREQKADNLKGLIDIIENGNANIILKEIYEISMAGRNPKQTTLLMALALCARYRVHDKLRPVPQKNEIEKEGSILFSKYINEMHTAAFAIVNDVCRIPTHLFAFVANCELVSNMTNTNVDHHSTGWGRLMRKTITHWYCSKTPYTLALHMTKYPQREGWSHRDLFRLAHPQLPQENHTDQLLEYEQLFRFAVKGDLAIRKRKLSHEENELQQPQAKYSAVQMDTEDSSRALDLIDAVLTIKNEKKESVVADTIARFNLVREHVPTNHLNSPTIWRALLPKMPLTALIRNLSKLSSMEMDDLSESLIVQKLTDVADIQRSRVHPITILIAKSVYDKGKGFRGKLEWKIRSTISDALETAYLASFKNVEPTNKRYCLAFDVSGSMTYENISNTMLSPRTASSALGLVHLKTEANVECVGFCDKLVELPYDKEWTVSKISDHMDSLTMGNTDCALPMLWAKEKNKKFDCFIVYTDNETFYGDVHPFEAMKQYREASGISDAKLVVMGMTATEFTIADPTDTNMLDIAGFDSAVPQLLSEFVLGQL